MPRQIKRDGVSMLEILLVVGVFTLLVALSIPVYESFQTQNDLAITVMNSAHAIRRAQLLSQSVSGDSPWGIKVQTSTLTLTIFKGVNFVSRDPDFDEDTEFSGAISATGTLEIVFSKLYGVPRPTGTIIFSNANQNSKSVTINAKGAAIY